MINSSPSPKQVYLDILAAAMLLTRLPVDWPEGETPDTARSYWAFSLIGLGVAALAGIPAAILLHYGMPPLAAAMLALALIAMITGGLHHDGLADIADGLGGNDPQSRLRIMRDSSIGSFGTLGLITTTVISVSCLATIAENGAAAMLHALITVAGLSRAMMAVQRHMTSTPDEKGLARMTGQPSAATAIIAVAIGLVIAISFSGISLGLLLMLVGAAVTLLLGLLLDRLVGGVNGDGLGATQQLCETTMLVVLAMAAM